MIGATATVGAFLAFGPAPAANADFDDLFQPIIDALSAVDPGIAADTDPGSALASLDTMLDGWYQNLVYTPINDLEQWLFGTGAADASTVGSAVATGTTATTPDSFTIPLQVNSTTEPVVNLSVGGGPESSVLVDTGSAGLVLPIWDINWSGIDWSDLTGLPQIGSSAFGSSLGYVYAELPTTVSFTDAAGDTVTSGPTTVDAVLFSFPIDLTTLFNGHWTISSYLGDNADGVLGIGANALGPTADSIPTAALPGALGQGVLINQAAGEMTFGANPLSGGTSVEGVPFAHLQVSIDNGPLQTVGAVIDSGGVHGTMPSSVLGDVTPTVNGYLPDGTTVDVYTADGHTLLYSYTVDSSDPSARSPIVVDGNDATMNTGNYPFAQQPIYISYSPAGNSTPTWDVGGTTIFGGVAPNTVAV
jgi:hypothetical protein